MGAQQTVSRLLSGSTAEGAAAMRAAGAMMADPAVRGPDAVAARLIPPGLRGTAMVKIPGLRRLLPAALELVLPGAVWFEVVRTRYMDAAVVQALAEGAEQVVILGAGYDSRAYRMPELSGSVPVFEVDRPAMSVHKQARVRAALGSPPLNVRFVAADLESDDLSAALGARGYRVADRTVVVCAGVTPYLEVGAVEDMLHWMAKQAPGSVLVFDYCWQEVVDGSSQVPAAVSLRRNVEALGEPLRFGVPRSGVADLVRVQGLELVEELRTAEDASGYLPGMPVVPATQDWTFGGIALTRVPVAP